MSGHENFRLRAIARGFAARVARLASPFRTFAGMPGTGRSVAGASVAGASVARRDDAPLELTAMHLEIWFGDYVEHTISLEDYIANVRAEIATIRDQADHAAHFAARLPVLGLRYRRRQQALDDALQAAQWCLNWAERRAAFSNCLAEAEDRWAREIQPVALAA